MGSFLGGCYSVCCCQCNFMIFPAPYPSYSREQKLMAYFTNSSGRSIPYLNLAHNNPKLNLIYFHGNAEDIGYAINFLLPIHTNLKANIYALEYPTYGTYNLSFPARISNHIKNDSLQFYQFLVRNKKSIINNKNTIILGRSIGSGGACYLASRKRIQRLVLVSPFSTIPNVAADFVGCTGRLVKCHFDNLQELRNYHGKLLVIHGKKDQVISFKHGKMVVECYEQNNPTQCTFVAPPNMTHNMFDFDKDILEPIEQFANQAL